MTDDQVVALIAAFVGVDRPEMSDEDLVEHAEALLRMARERRMRRLPLEANPRMP